jgi:hypothetical protein
MGSCLTKVSRLSLVGTVAELTASEQLVLERGMKPIGGRHFRIIKACEKTRIPSFPHDRCTNRNIGYPTISSPGFSAAYRIALVSQSGPAMHGRYALNGRIKRTRLT